MLSPEKKRELKDMFSLFMETFHDSEMKIYAIVVTYYMLLSFFPLLIAIGNILPFLHINENTVLPYIRELLPPDVYAIMNDTIKSLLETSSGGLLSISAIGTFWAISKGINGIRISLDKAYGIGYQKKAFIKRIAAFFMVFLLLLALIVLMFAMAFGQTILEYVLPRIGLPNDILHTFKTLRWPVTSSILFVTLVCIYYFVPSAKIHFRTIIPGTIFTTVSWMIVTQFFSLYVTHFSKRITSYGIIGGFIIFMFWLDIAASIVIIGGIINVTLEKFFYGSITTKQTKLGTYIQKKTGDIKQQAVAKAKGHKASKLRTKAGIKEEEKEIEQRALKRKEEHEKKKEDHTKF